MDDSSQKLETTDMLRIIADAMKGENNLPGCFIARPELISFLAVPLFSAL